MPDLRQETEEMLRAMATARPESAELRGRLGLLYQSTGRERQALVEFRAAFDATPSDPLGRYNYAAALHAGGDFSLSLELLDEGLLATPGDYRLHYGRGCSMQSTGRPDDARNAFLKAVELQPDLADGWYAIATLEHAAGHDAMAIECYQKVLGLEPENAAARHMLDALIGQQSRQPPGEFAKGLFDSYAAHYDEHLIGTLDYRGPELVGRALLTHIGARSDLRVLDLGCGTGLFGERIRPIAGLLTGVDISPNMVAKAEGRDCYNSVVVAEILDYLQSADPGSFDLIAAVDVFIYLGSLSEVIVACARALDRNGVLAFTAEVGDVDFKLDRSGRYAHSAAYLSELRDLAGFELLSISEETIRQESNAPCRAFVNVWRRPAA